MPDDYAEHLRQHDEILRSLTAMLVKQDSINDDLREFTRQQVGINERLTAAIERLDLTQARLETLFTRLFRPEDNGRDA